MTEAQGTLLLEDTTEIIDLITSQNELLTTAISEIKLFMLFLIFIVFIYTVLKITYVRGE